MTGHQIQIVDASDEDEIDKAFATLQELHADALIVGADPCFFGRAAQLIARSRRDIGFQPFLNFASSRWRAA